NVPARNHHFVIPASPKGPRLPRRAGCMCSFHTYGIETARPGGLVSQGLEIRRVLPGSDVFRSRGWVTRLHSVPSTRSSISTGDCTMRSLATKLWNDESGQGLAEYALLLGLIVIGVVAIIAGMGTHIQTIF